MGDGPPNGALSVVTTPVFVVGVWVTNAVNGDRLAVALTIVNGAAESLDGSVAVLAAERGVDLGRAGRRRERHVDRGAAVGRRSSPKAPEPPMPTKTALPGSGSGPAFSSTVTAGLWPNVPLAGVAGAITSSVVSAAAGPLPATW